uniref:Reverse transcriptase RNase H-like domain-containing protein n=1 Tax=Amphimedon queenslandica TaxID=400682 RepID=A0A1X7USX1_AMPQE
MPNEEERPIAFPSRTMSPAECNYSQLKKEALSIIFGIKNIHQYLFGRHFTLLTDH